MGSPGTPAFGHSTWELTRRTVELNLPRELESHQKPPDCAYHTEISKEWFFQGCSPMTVTACCGICVS
jgi:hypothetical protein